MEYLDYIVAAYGVTAFLLSGLVIATWLASRRADQQLMQQSNRDQA